MKINVKLMTEEAYQTLKKNVKDVYQNMVDHPTDSAWIKDYLGFEPYETKKYEIEDFELDFDENYDVVAYNNAVKLYEALNKLPKYILCNNRFWAWINFEKAYKQSIHATKNFNEQILTNLWFHNGTRRDLMLGVMSRYYNMVNVSVDELNTKDKYELTKYILTNAETYRGFSYRNLGMMKNITLGVLQAEKDYSELTGEQITKLPSAQVVKAASRIGSVMLLDILSKEDMYNALLPKIVKIMNSFKTAE